MCRRCLALLLALFLWPGCAPRGSDARAQERPTDDAKTQEQTAAKQQQTAAKTNAQPGRQQPSPSEKQVEKVMHAVFNVGVGQQLTVFLKNGDTLHGTLAEIREDDFQIAEVDRRQTLTVRYDEVKKIRKGFGGINLFTGHRTHPSRGSRIAVFAGLSAAIFLLPIIIVASGKN